MRSDSGMPREVAELLEHWQATGIPLNVGASAEQIAAVEQQCGMRIPDVLRSLYQAANGMAHEESDLQFFSFWPVEQLVSEATAWRVPAGESVLLFGDFLMASHAYAVRCAGLEAGSVHIFAGDRFEKVADSLNDFFAAVVGDASRVGLLGGDPV